MFKDDLILSHTYLNFCNKLKRVGLTRLRVKMLFITSFQIIHRISYLNVAKHH